MGAYADLRGGPAPRLPVAPQLLRPAELRGAHGSNEPGGDQREAPVRSTGMRDLGRAPWFRPFTVFFFVIVIHLLTLFLAVLGLVAAHWLSVVAVSGATPHFGAQASLCVSFSCSRAQALGALAQASVVVARGLIVASQHVGSSRTRDQTHVPSMAGRLLTT